MHQRMVSSMERQSLKSIGEAEKKRAKVPHFVVVAVPIKSAT